MDFEDCVYNKTDDGNIMVGGYTLNSILTEYPLMYSNAKVDVDTDTTKKQIVQQGGNFTSLFKDLAVPAGLLYLQQNFKPSKDSATSQIKVYNEPEVISDSLYDSLLQLVSKNKQRKHNRKSRKERTNKRRNSTRRRR